MPYYGNTTVVHELDTGDFKSMVGMSYEVVCILEWGWCYEVKL